MIVQSYPVKNMGLPGNVLAISFNSPNDNGVIQQTVVQNGNPSGITYQGVIIDARNSLAPFRLQFGPGPTLSFDVSQGGFFQRQIPAISNMTVCLTWDAPPGASVIASGTQGPIIYLLSYPVQSADFTIPGGVATWNALVLNVPGSVTVYDGSGIMTGMSMTAGISTGFAGFELTDGLGNVLWSGYINGRTSDANLTWNLTGLEVPFFEKITLSVTFASGTDPTGEICGTVYYTPS